MLVTKFSASTSDSTITSPLIDRFYERGYISIKFYSDAELKNIVTPTGGTVTFTASEDGEQYGDVENFAANTAGENSTYTRPTFGGLVRFVRANMASIVGANFYQVTIGSFERGQ